MMSAKNSLGKICLDMKCCLSFSLVQPEYKDSTEMERNNRKGKCVAFYFARNLWHGSAICCKQPSILTSK